LSGGNLQKFIVGREIDAAPKLLIVSQPTWGVDVGAAAQIRAELLALRDAGCAVLVVSEELDELFEICDRLLVIAQGRLSPSLPTAQATPEQIGEWMSGLWPKDVAPTLPAARGSLPPEGAFAPGGGPAALKTATHREDGSHA
jgi:simple sugar transport system ATP-binding protein